MLPKKDLDHPSESEKKLISKEQKEMTLDRKNISENNSNSFVMTSCDYLSQFIFNMRKSGGKEKQEAILEVREAWKALKKGIEEYLVAFEDVKSQCKADKNDSIMPWVTVREKACERILQQVVGLEEKLSTLEAEASKRHNSGISGAIKAKLFKNSPRSSVTGVYSFQAKKATDSLKDALRRGLEVESDLLLREKSPERSDQLQSIRRS